MVFKKSIFLLLLWLYASYYYGQDNSAFLEFNLASSKAMKKNVTFNWNLGYKQQLNDEFKWKRTYFNFSFSKNFNANWKGMVGLNNIYTTQIDREDFYEIRPWVGPQLNVPIVDRLMFQQVLKYEIRNFFYTKDKSHNDIQNRLRYKIHLDYNLNKNPEKKDNWSLNTGYEWYFINEPNTGEQFSNVRTFAFRLKKNTLKNTSYYIQYNFNRVNTFRNPNGSDTHTIELNYTF